MSAKKRGFPKNIPTQRKLVGQIKINIYSDGSLNVNDFPENYAQAMDIMHGAVKALGFHFLEKAKGEKEPSRIIKLSAN